MSPKKGVGSPKASAGVGAFKRLSEIPGVLEEGKIFFFYRHSPFYLFCFFVAVRRVHHVGGRASACAINMSYTFCIMVPAHDHRVSSKSEIEGTRVEDRVSCARILAGECRVLMGGASLCHHDVHRLYCPWSMIALSQGLKAVCVLCRIGPALRCAVKKDLVLSKLAAANLLPGT